MTEAEKGLGARWFEEVWNQGRRDAAAELLSADAVLHEAGKDSIGPAGFHEFFDRMTQAFSNIQVTIEDTIIDGDKICLRWVGGLDHSGDGLGMPATNRRVHVTGITIMRVANGKMVEGWQNWDMLGMMQQIQERNRAVTYVALD